MSQEISEEEVRKRLRQAEEYFPRYKHAKAWELLSPLLDMRDSYSESLAAEISIYAGFASLGVNDKEQARILLEDGLRRAKAVDYRTGEAIALAALGELLLKKNQPDEALNNCQQALSILKEVDDSRYLGYVYQATSHCYEAVGRLEKALSFQMQSLRAHRAIGKKWAECANLIHIASLHYDFGHFQEAITYSKKAVQLAEELDDPGIIMKSTLLEGVVLKRQGRLIEARNFFQNAIMKFDELYKDKPPAGLLRGFFFNLANIFEHLGEHEEAKAIYIKLLKEEQGSDEDFGLYAATGLGRILVARASFEEAAKYLEEGIAKLRSKKAKGLHLAEQLILLSTVYVELDELEKAEELLNEVAKFETESNYTRVVVEFGKGFFKQAERNLRSAKESFERCLDLAAEVGLAEYRIKALFHLAALELYEYRISGAQDSFQRMRAFLDDAYAIALDSNMPILGLEIGILKGLSCSAALDFECAVSFLEESMFKAKELDLTKRIMEIDDLIQEVQSNRRKAAEMANPEARLAGKKLAEYIDNLQNVIRSYGEERT